MGSLLMLVMMSPSIKRPYWSRFVLITPAREAGPPGVASNTSTPEPSKTHPHNYISN
jgi:hypothetical protein